LDVFFREFWSVLVRFGVGFGCFSSVFDVIFRPITHFLMLAGWLFGWIGG